MKPQALILRTAGTNCDAETAHAFEQAGASSVYLHLNRLIENPRQLNAFQILAIPGGFSYGDDIAAGRIFANQLVHHLRDSLEDFISAGKPIIGICNGFQVLVKANLLPGHAAGPAPSGAEQTCTLTNNDSGRFTDRWISLARRSNKCIWTADLDDVIELPIAHGEGKFVPRDEDTRRLLWENDQVALVYVRHDGSAAGGQFPDNPNGSIDDIAGICDTSGLVFGLMPHPERHISPFQHPAWASQKHRPLKGAGLAIFRNSVQHVAQAVGSGI